MDECSISACRMSELHKACHRNGADAEQRCYKQLPPRQPAEVKG